ncbi:zinc-dependent metalloprotease [Chitinophaga skermanii]
MRTFIRRWRLEPKPGDVEKYKKGVLVEPAKQIVIYIDPATPKQWRPYLIAGVNDWQKAFEQAGFKNAIVGKEWPNEDSVDYYINDARYSFIRYLPSEAMNAYGPVVYDPRSGEILQTHIGWYHNVMKLLRNWYFIQAAPLDPAARKPVFDEKLMGQLIRFVSSHEVGHTLGLLHNFGASSRTPVDSLRNKQYLAKYGHTSSIMDYARFNYVAQPEDNIPRELLFPGIGEYDKWAIEWGYKFSTDDYVTNKKKNFQLVTNRLANNSRLWFGDGESRQNDPRAQTEDLGDNSMKANAYGIKNLQRIMANLEEWTKEENGDYTFMREIHREVERQFTRYITHVFRNIDGFYTTPRAESNGGDMFEPSPKEKVREALAFLDEQLFTTPTWLVNKAIVNKTSVPNFESFVYDIQIKGMNAMLDIGTMNTILANGEQFKGKAINIEEYINIAHGMIWRDLKNGEVKDIYRRNLQKSYIGSLQNVLLSNIPVNTETDVYSLAKADMKQVKQEIEQALPLAKDNLTKIHLEDLLDRIKKVLEAKP